MMVREKRDVRPVLLKFGVALALSLGGIIYTFFRTKRIKPSKSPRSPHSSDEERTELRNDDHSSQTTPKSYNLASPMPEKYEELSLPGTTIDNSSVGLSPSGKSNGDRDGYLLPEFNELVKEFNAPTTKTGASPRKDVERICSDVESPGEHNPMAEDTEQEIKNLRNLVKILKERERTLEFQLLEYYGLKEQEAAVMELQNRLKINNMEAKLYSLKIESLQAENRRLEAQVSDYGKVVTELEAAKSKIKILKKKLRTEAEHNREQILTLQERVMKLQDQERKANASDSDNHPDFLKIKDLEEEAEQLRKSNNSLRLENSELARKMEYVQALATSVLEGDEEMEALKEESSRLKEQNEALQKEVEQLRADRCSDAEELVYLRWINACLRYELRNYQPGTGKTVARDLSKTLSPKSEEKAKQLILEYANKEGQGEKGLNMAELDSDQWSSSQASYLTDSGELDDSSVDTSSANRTNTNTSSKIKVFGKLMRLLRGKDSHHHSRNSSLERTPSIEDTVGRYSIDSPRCSSNMSTGMDTGIDGLKNRFSSSSQVPSRRSLDLQRGYQPGSKSAREEDDNSFLERMRRKSDGGSSSGLKRIESITEDDCTTETDQFDHTEDMVHKAELVKYAEVLKDSRAKASFRRRSVSFSSF